MSHSGRAATFINSLNIRKELGEKLQLTSSLIGMARYALFTSNPIQAAKLLGLVDAVVKPLHITVEPDLLHFHAQTLVKVKEALGEAAFQSAWEEGAKWSLEEAVKWALEANDE